MSNQNQNQDVEIQIERIFQSIQARPEFKHRLEKELLAKQPAVRPHLFIFRPLFAAPALTIALLVLAFLAIGPNRVLAEARKLLSYLPGIGFADAQNTRVLVQPVEVQREGITVRIEKVVADDQQTKVWFTVRGLPTNLPPDNDSSHSYLLLPNGERKTDLGYGMRVGNGRVDGDLMFGWIPPEDNQLILLLPRLPSVPMGMGPENWEIPFEVQAPGEVIQPVLPMNNSVSDHGFTLTVLNVARSTTDTGVSLRVDWNDPDLATLAGLDMELHDEQGRGYQRLETIRVTEDQYLPGVGYPLTREQRLRYAPLDAGVNQITLQASKIIFKANKSGTYFFDPGIAPTAGQQWDLKRLSGSMLAIGGIPVQLLDAQLINQKTQSVSPGEVASFALIVHLKALPMPGRELASVAAIPGDGKNILGTDSSLEGDGSITLTYYLRTVPSQPVKIQLEDSLIQVNGTWKIDMQLP